MHFALQKKKYVVHFHHFMSRKPFFSELKFTLSNKVLNTFLQSLWVKYPFKKI